MHSRVRSFSGAVALTLLAGACSDGPISPAASPAALRNALSGGSGQPPLVPAHIKYSDQGARPATGRSGGATLTAYALQGKDGVTSLAVTAALAGADSQAVALSKVQVKQFDTDGDLLRTVNDNRRSGGASATYSYAGLGRGAALQVQANVGTGARTGVVTVTETIHLRPDLRASLQAPGAALVGTPVNITATVMEANGDVGARANCVLMVNDVQADRADGIWVDAGDAVNCAFTHIFTAPGTARLRVLVLDVVPGDYDDANNFAEATTEVAGPEPESSDFSYYAQADEGVIRQHYVSMGRTEYPEYGFIVSDTSITDQTHTFASTLMNGWMTRSVSLPLTRVELRQESAGTVFHSATYTDMSGNEYEWVDQPGCTSRWDGGGVLFYVCTSGPEFPSTSFQYMVYGAMVVYASESYVTLWYTETGETYYFYSRVEPDGSPHGISLFTLGSDARFSVKITDGEQTYQATARVYMGEPETQTWTQFEPTGTFCDSGFYDPTQSWSRCWTHQGTTTIRRGWTSYYTE